MRNKILIGAVVVLLIAVVLLAIGNCKLKKEISEYEEAQVSDSEEIERLKSIINYFMTANGNGGNTVNVDLPLIQGGAGTSSAGVGTGLIEPSIAPMPPTRGGASQGSSGSAGIMIDAPMPDASSDGSWEIAE